MPGQSIETLYKGVSYRSREEARWAIFFDAIGIEVKYEPDGFALDGGYMYLPDFRIDSLQLIGSIHRELKDTALYVEVKPNHSRLDAAKLEAFYKDGHCLYICDQIPDDFYQPARLMNPDTDHYYHSQWLINHQQNKLIFCIDKRGRPALMDPYQALYFGCDHDATARAYLRAHNAYRLLPEDPSNRPLFGVRPKKSEVKPI